jgi:hypothetical protein
MSTGGLGNRTLNMWMPTYALVLAFLAVSVALEGAAQGEDVPSERLGLFRGATVGGRLGVVSLDHGQLWGPRDPYSAPAGRPDPALVGLGFSVEGDLGYRIARSFALYGFWEHTFFLSAGIEGGNAVGAPWSDVIGAGIRADLHSLSRAGLYVDVGQGYRWLGVPQPIVVVPLDGASPGGIPSQTFTYRGWEFVRAAIGMSFALTPRSRWEVAATGSAGLFTNVEGWCCSSSVPGAGRSVHGFGGLAASTHWDL